MNPNNLIQAINSAHRKDHEFVANKVDKILKRTDVSQWKDSSDMTNRVDSKANDSEQQKRKLVAHYAGLIKVPIN